MSRPTTPTLPNGHRWALVEVAVATRARVAVPIPATWSEQQLEDAVQRFALELLDEAEELGETEQTIALTATSPDDGVAWTLSQHPPRFSCVLEPLADPGPVQAGAA